MSSSNKEFSVVGEQRVDGDVPQGETIGSSQLDMVWDIVHDKSLKNADRLLLLRYYLLLEGGLSQTNMTQNKDALGWAYNTAKDAHSRLRKAGLLGGWANEGWKFRVNLPEPTDRVMVRRVSRCHNCAEMEADANMLKQTLHLLVKQGKTLELTDGLSITDTPPDNQDMKNQTPRAGVSSRKNITKLYEKDSLLSESKTKKKHLFNESFEEFNRLRRLHGGATRDLSYKVHGKAWRKAHGLALGDSDLLLKAWRMVLTSPDKDWWLKTRGLGLAATFLREVHLTGFLLEAEGWDEPSVEDKAKVEHRASQVAAMASLEDTSDTILARMWVLNNSPWVQGQRRKGREEFCKALNKRVTHPQLVLEYLKM